MYGYGKIRSGIRKFGGYADDREAEGGIYFSLAVPLEVAQNGHLDIIDEILYAWEVG